MKLQKCLGVVMAMCGMAALILLGDFTVGSIFILVGVALMLSRKMVLV